jgi:PKD repeat protein
MKKILFVLSFLLISICGMQSQNSQQDKAYNILNNRGEVYFSFSVDTKLARPHMLEQLSRIISIDQIENNTVKAYANHKEFSEFLKLGIDYQVLTAPSMLIQPLMLDLKEARNAQAWDFYPTYPAYVSLMNQFATDYPDLCEVVNIKTLASTRQILCIHINDSLGVDQNEPEFLYTSSIHGDETTGYVLMLHLVDYLLKNYGIDEQATNLVNNVDIWINPLANPDGTYAGGDNNIYGATRYNANWVDLNRNYADPEDGPHSDGNDYQPETQAFMDFAAGRDFVMSANFHGGAEVLNYPWDTWQRLSADDAWWQYVCRQYADTAHANSPSGYLTDLNNGITNGYAWYSISGGRQDYMNYFQRCREVTAEISSIKLLPANQLEAFWEYNYRSLLNYIEQSLYGVRGLVSNASTGAPIAAKVSISGYDMDNTEVYASMPIGNYHRPLKAGTYNITFSAFGYVTKTINNVEINDENTVILDVQLEPLVNLTANFYANETLIGLGEAVNFTDQSLGNNIVSWQWAFEGATPATSSDKDPQNIVYSTLGEFDVSLTVTSTNGTQNTMLKENYIQVYDFYSMVDDTTVYTCSSLFYDSGGNENNYSDNESKIMTFISNLEGGYLKVIFEKFDLENSSDCTADYLEIYDGNSVDAPFIGKFCGDELPVSISTSNVEGAVTFRFVSNSTITNPGWKALISCDTNVGIPDANHILLKVYPNPAEKFVNIVSQLVINKVNLRNIAGIQVQSILVNSEKARLDVRHLAPGIYVAEIISENLVSYKKIIVR